MAGLIKAIRGMHDTLPDISTTWHYLEHCVREILATYGYQEIRLPILEKTELFERSIGETSDIVTKEMYTFEDRNSDHLTLRPEGTAGCVRAVLEHGLIQSPALRLWYSGPMFRHERPQKGRTRQFHQIGVEAFGLPGPDIDAELIIMCTRIWNRLQLNDLRLEINSLGSTDTRKKYRNILVDYFNSHKDQLDDDDLNRLENNPLRILDSKNPEMKDLVNKAPSITDSMDSESQNHFQDLLQLLDSVDIRYQINPRLVRGLDYYNRTVFEWITEKLGAQGTVCGGGRYDGMVKHFGGPSTPGIGFSMGLERLVYLIEKQENQRFATKNSDIYFVIASNEAQGTAIKLAEKIRNELPEVRLLMHCGGGSFKSQFKKADKSGALIALILGDDELQQQRIGIKHLRDDKAQQEVDWESLTDTVRKLLDI